MHAPGQPSGAGAQKLYLGTKRISSRARRLDGRALTRPPRRAPGGRWSGGRSSGSPAALGGTGLVTVIEGPSRSGRSDGALAPVHRTAARPAAPSLGVPLPSGPSRGAAVGASSVRPPAPRGLCRFDRVGPAAPCFVLASLRGPVAWRARSLGPLLSESALVGVRPAERRPLRRPLASSRSWSGGGLLGAALPPGRPSSEAMPSGPPSPRPGLSLRAAPPGPASPRRRVPRARPLSEVRPSAASCSGPGPGGAPVGPFVSPLGALSARGPLCPGSLCWGDLGPQAPEGRALGPTPAGNGRSVRRRRVGGASRGAGLAWGRSCPEAPSRRSPSCTSSDDVPDLAKTRSNKYLSPDSNHPPSPSKSGSSPLR